MHANDRKLRSFEDIAAMGTDPIPSEPYYHPDYHALEREAVFRNSWLVMGRVEEVARPGDFLVKDLDVVDSSVLIARARDGTLRAFHNVCPHRGSILVQGKAGNTPAFTCRYHAWTFNLDGSVKAVPDRGGFYDLDLSTCGLAPIRLDEFAGFLFVNLAPDPQPLRAFLGGMGDLLLKHDFSPYSAFAEFDNVLEANWKTAQDNFQETYHVATVHHRTAAAFATSPANPRGHPWYELYGPHRRMRLWQNTEYQPPHFGAVIFRHAMTGNGTAASGPRADDPNDGLDVHALFPNFHINLNADNYFTHEFWPLGPNRTRMIGRLYFAPATTVGQRLLQEYRISSTRDIWAEDWPIVESVGRGVRSGALSHYHLHAHEMTCRHLFETVDGMVSDHRLRSSAQALAR